MAEVIHTPCLKNTATRALHSAAAAAHEEWFVIEAFKAHR